MCPQFQSLCVANGRCSSIICEVNNDRAEGKEVLELSEKDFNKFGNESIGRKRRLNGRHVGFFIFVCVKFNRYERLEYL